MHQSGGERRLAGAGRTCEDDGATANGDRAGVQRQLVVQIAQRAEDGSDKEPALISPGVVDNHRGARDQEPRAALFPAEQ